MKTHLYNLVFRPEPEGGYTVLVPSLPGCLTYAATIEEGKQLILEAIEAYLGSLAKHSEDVPDDADTFISSVNLVHA